MYLSSFIVCGQSRNRRWGLTVYGAYSVTFSLCYRAQTPGLQFSALMCLQQFRFELPENIEPLRKFGWFC